MGVQLRNRAVSSLLTGIGADDVTLRVLDADADRFPALDLPSDWFVAALVDTSHNTEFIRVTARNANLFTVERGQEGTVARAFSAGDRVELRVTAQAWEGLARNDWHRPLDAAGNVVAPKLLNAASFALKGDWSAFFPVHRAVRVFQNADAAGYVASSNYEARAGRTVVSVAGLSLDAGLVLVEVGQDVKAAPRYGHAATADHATSADRAEQADSASTFGGRAPSHYALAHHGHSVDDLTEVVGGKFPSSVLNIASEDAAKTGKGTGLMSAALVRAAIEAQAKGCVPHIEIITASQTWTVPEGVFQIMVEVVGGGGGGNRAKDIVKPSVDYTSRYGAGPSGAYALKALKVTPGAQYEITIGKGGRGNGSNGFWGDKYCRGENGGTSSFGSEITCTGGGNIACGPGVATGGDINLNGEQGIPCSATGNDGRGGHTPYGRGGYSMGQGNAKAPSGSGFGSGGGPTSGTATHGSVAGDGQPGCVIIRY
ncbi:glycine-rich domain-containing protein [Pseudodesulfovibrio tunisiensis]|uniref:glycine-rich domain-containing protein n=1 Tax=Pseudodesulfovibrio tunisiensis TaxID=463192 RepID=UPI001FB23310|nr:hypothetical protein [Pseudodesulfovibrio tunisiensis]